MTPECRSATPWQRITRTGSSGWRSPRPRCRAVLNARFWQLVLSQLPGSKKLPDDIVSVPDVGDYAKRG